MGFSDRTFSWQSFIQSSKWSLWWGKDLTPQSLSLSMFLGVQWWFVWHTSYECASSGSCKGKSSCPIFRHCHAYTSGTQPGSILYKIKLETFIFIVSLLNQFELWASKIHWHFSLFPSKSETWVKRFSINAKCHCNIYYLPPKAHVAFPPSHTLTSGSCLYWSEDFSLGLL